MKFGNAKDIFDSALTISLLIVVILFPIISNIKLYKNFSNLKEDEFMTKYGSLYSELKLKHSSLFFLVSCFN
mgnify:CR=1 FL=1